LAKWHANSCFLDLNQHNSSVPNDALLDLILTNVNDLFVSISYYPIVTLDNYHPPLVDFKLIFDCKPTPLTPRHSYTKGDYLLLYNTLSNCDWSCVLNETSINSAVYKITACVSNLLMMPFRLKDQKVILFLTGSPNLLFITIRNKSVFKKYKKPNSDYYYSIFSYYRKLIKTTIKAKRLIWLKSIDENLRTQPKHIWRYG
jgi:hypothetical protein